MPIAAIPEYLGNDFKSASPGQRFGMYLPIWTARADQEADVRKRAEAKSREGDEVSSLLSKGMEAVIAALRQRDRKPLAGLWDKNDFASRQAWRDVCALNKGDIERIKALVARQSEQVTTFGASDLLRLQATAIAPFTTGLGNEHPLENGFAFLNPYGLPYLAGSGVKGVLRAAAQELASGQWDSKEWHHAEDLHPEVHNKHGQRMFDASDLDVLFGSEALNGENHLRGVLSFWDVIPQIEGNSLMVEIMTPHQSHYYQDKAVAGSTSPHDSGSPNPISFLTVPPNSRFAFHVVCDTARLQDLAPDLANNERWKALLTEAFEHAFAWLGFGGKTSVGYGAMESEAMRQQKRDEAKKREDEAREQKKQQDAQRQEQSAQAWAGAKVKFNRANKSLSVEKDGQTAVALQPKGEELLGTLPPELRSKIMGNQFVKVTAFVAEGVLVRVSA
ncbi:type III-B CRISPR module RAMP protein Cmr6 [Limnohabitans sp.]|jgi:CRISPR-associated protein Cmr6|uniref:type III-B CRISPR module RAMP protein Cmr6 n=1 Tax=Limnohabitans sp. TaxID=1907725 RepID=UPI0037BEF375